MFTRRQLLRVGAGASLAGMAARPLAASAPDVAGTPSVAVDRGNIAVFPLGVASADPGLNGIVLWTHIALDQCKTGEMLVLEIASDAQFTALVITRFLTDAVQLQHDGCATVVIDDGLQPDTYYWYRFHYANAISRVGRCRTLPLKGAVNAPLRIAAVNCQEFSNGYYAAYHHLSREEDVVFVLHLGDSIYERVAGKAYLQQMHASRRLRLPSGSDVAMDLADYRALYRHYRADPDFQDALAMHPFVFQMDDHELANNTWWDAQNAVMGVADHPYGDAALYPDGVVRLRQLQRDAMQAWSEYMPSRLPLRAEVSGSKEDVHLYRRMEVGDVALLLMDSRLYRSKQPCKKSLLPLGCDDYLQPDLTLLGEQQRLWLTEQLQDSRPRWTILASQVAMSRIAVGNARQPWGVANTDAWDGYAQERAHLMAALRATQRRRFVVLSGDMHATLAGVLQPGELIPGVAGAEEVFGAEFMSPPVSSAATIDLLFPRLRSSGVVRRITASMVETLFCWMNPHLQFVSIQSHGYSLLDITADTCRWQAKVVEIDLPAAQSPVRVAADFVYDPDRIGQKLFRSI